MLIQEGFAGIQRYAPIPGTVPGPVSYMETAARSLHLVVGVPLQTFPLSRPARHLKPDCREPFLELVAITQDIVGMLVALLAHLRVG